MTIYPTKMCAGDRCYMVSGKYQNQHEAAKTLHRLHKDCLRVVKHMRNTYLWGQQSTDPGFIIRCKLAKNLTQRYDADVLVENIPLSEGDTSYTTGKGQKLAVCLRNKHTNELEPYDTLLFVALHELSHISTDIPHHKPPFWLVFKIILGEAAKIGVYRPINYNERGIEYCGLAVRHNPYFDSSMVEEDLYGMIDYV